MHQRNKELFLINPLYFNKLRVCFSCNKSCQVFGSMDSSISALLALLTWLLFFIVLMAVANLQDDLSLDDNMVSNSFSALDESLRRDGLSFDGDDVCDEMFADGFSSDDAKSSSPSLMDDQVVGAKRNVTWAQNQISRKRRTYDLDTKVSCLKEMQESWKGSPSMVSAPPSRWAFIPRRRINQWKVEGGKNYVEYWTKIRDDAQPHQRASNSKKRARRLRSDKGIFLSFDFKLKFYSEFLFFFLGVPKFPQVEKNVLKELRIRCKDGGNRDDVWIGTYAQQQAQDLCVSNFSASTTWIAEFKSRHKISKTSFLEIVQFFFCFCLFAEPQVDLFKMLVSTVVPKNSSNYLDRGYKKQDNLCLNILVKEMVRHF